MKAIVYYVEQSYGSLHHTTGEGDWTRPIGLLFAVDEDQARKALPASAHNPPGDGPGTWGHPQFWELGEVEVAQELPIFLEIQG